MDIKDILESKENFVILGEPGSGKTSLLEEILLNLNKSKGSDLIPVYISLKGYVPNPNDRGTLKSYILAEIVSGPMKSFSENYFNNNSFLFLL